MNEKFLEAYKNLENELRFENKSVLDYENSLKDTNLQEKLKLCRITRNYMSHNDIKFVSATNNMIEFLNNLTKEIRLKANIVKDEMKKIKGIYINEPIKNIIPMCAKNVVPIIDKKTNKLLYVVDSFILVQQLAKGNKKIEIPKKIPQYNYINTTERLKGLKGLYIVTSDGTKDGKYIGILNI